MTVDRQQSSKKLSALIRHGNKKTILA